MKILIVSNIKSPFVQNLIKMLPKDYEVDLYDYANSSETEYQGHKLIKPSKSVLLYKKLHLKPLQFSALVKEFEEHFKNYDIINMHYATLWFTRLLGHKKLSAYRKKFIASYWGSDLFRNDADTLKKLKGEIEDIGYITFSNNDLCRYHKELYGDIATTRQVSMFPVVLIKEMDELKGSPTIHDIADQHIPEDKIVIATGYNGRVQQNHIAVIESLKGVKKEYLDKMVLILQMTSGCDDEYRRQVADKAREVGISPIVFDKFLSDEDVARIRLVTDIYINAQTTDAFSASVNEYLYTGTALINAAWLRYAEFEMNPFSYLEFKEYSEIPELLTGVIENEFVPDAKVNRELIRELKGKDKCRENWIEIYNKVYDNSK